MKEQFEAINLTPTRQIQNKARTGKVQQSPKLCLEECIKQLPTPEPGKTISISIELFPFWLAYHQRWIDRVVDHPLILIGVKREK